MDHTVTFYDCTALPFMGTVLKNQACNIYKYWSYNRNIRVVALNPQLISEKAFKLAKKTLWLHTCHLNWWTGLLLSAMNSIAKHWMVRFMVKPWVARFWGPEKTDAQKVTVYILTTDEFAVQWEPIICLIFWPTVQE